MIPPTAVEGSSDLGLKKAGKAKGMVVSTNYVNKNTTERYQAICMLSYRISF